MKINKGIVRNINKKLIAGSLAITLTLTSLVGCANVSIDDIKYTKNEQGYVQGIDTINKETLKYCGIYKVRDTKGDKLYHTICLRDDFNGTYQVKYYDVFTGQELKYSDYNFRLVETLDNYLEVTKTKYTDEELREMLNEFLEKEEQYKKLVKE